MSGWNFGGQNSFKTRPAEKLLKPRSGVHAAIDCQVRAGDVRRIRTGDERHHRGDIVHMAIAVECSRGLLRIAQSPAAGFKSVSMGPGCTLLTVMPRLPTSLDNPFVKIFMAPFVAA